MVLSSSFSCAALISSSTKATASSFCFSSVIAALDAVRIGKCNCVRLIGFSDRFIHYLRRRLRQKSLIAGRRSLPSSQYIAEFRECLNRNEGRAHRKLCTLCAEHPHRKGTECVVGKLTENQFSIARFHPPVYAQRLTKQRMPAVVHRHRFKTMCIMFQVRQALGKVTWPKPSGRRSSAKAIA